MHLTVLMLDLKEEARFNAAKTVLEGLQRNILEEILGATGGQDPKPVELTFQGLKTMQNNNPAKSRVLYIDIKQDEHYRTLERIADMIIKKFLEKGVTTERELDHVKLNPRS